MTTRLHVIGVIASVILHGGALAAVWSYKGIQVAPDDSNFFDRAHVIEAGLAMRKAPKKKRQPQKKKKKTYRPKEAAKISRDADRTPVKATAKKDLPPKADEIDFASVLEKNREQDEDLSTHGSDDVGQGDEETSFSGRLAHAKGDPYVALLAEQIYNTWKVPSLETAGGSVLGCILLEPDGKIAKFEVKRKSKNSNLNRSVYLALKNAPAMAEPVPDRVKGLLTGTGICLNFNMQNQ